MEQNQENKKKKRKIWIPIVLIIILVITLLCCFKMCGKEETPSGSGFMPSTSNTQTSGNLEEWQNEDGSINLSKWLLYLESVYDLKFGADAHEYFSTSNPVAITVEDTDEYKRSILKFEGMDASWQNSTVWEFFEVTAELSGDKNTKPKTGELLLKGESYDLMYFYGDDDPEPIKTWDYTYNNVKYNIALSLNMNENVEITVTQYK